MRPRLARRLRLEPVPGGVRLADTGGAAGVWASDGVRFALECFGDDRTAARLAAVVARWSSRQVRPAYAQRASALRVFTALGSDAALRMLDELGREAADQTRIGPGALAAMREIAERRGLTGQQLAARLE